jgi:DNA-directed RNA polymerase subunit M/transcription elongation factor TFIIS
MKDINHVFQCPKCGQSLGCHGGSTPRKFEYCQECGTMMEYQGTRIDGKDIGKIDANTLAESQLSDESAKNEATQTPDNKSELNFEIEEVHETESEVEV